MKTKEKLRLLEKIVGEIELTDEIKCSVCIHNPKTDDCLTRNGKEVSCLFRFDARKGKKLLEAK